MVFKWLLLSSPSNKCLFVAIDEFSRFLFAIPCKDTSSKIVIQCLQSTFSLCEVPSYSHSDQGLGFLAQDVKEYLLLHQVASSKTTPYNPQGNAQVERYNDIIWKTIRLMLESQNLPLTHWESVRPQVLHSFRFTLSTAANAILHERFFSFFW